MRLHKTYKTVLIPTSYPVGWDVKVKEDLNGSKSHRSSIEIEKILQSRKASRNWSFLTPNSIWDSVALDIHILIQSSLWDIQNTSLNCFMSLTPISTFIYLFLYKTHSFPTLMEGLFLRRIWNTKVLAYLFLIVFYSIVELFLIVIGKIIWILCTKRGSCL